MRPNGTASGCKASMSSSGRPGDDDAGCRGGSARNRRAPATIRCTVDGATPAASAACRKLLPGSSAKALAMAARPAAESTGLRRPSRPVLVPGPKASAAWRMRATVEWESPQTSANQRSERSGHLRSRAPAAACRSLRLSGFPCLILAWTATTNASVSLPSKNTALISVRPVLRDASTRCTPSITFIVLLSTTTGGTRSSTSASASTWSSSTLLSLGE